MAEKVRYLLFPLSVIALISFAASDISAKNVKCEITCALNYSQVSFFCVIFRPNHSQITAFSPQANSLSEAKVPVGPWPIRSLELSLSGTLALILLILPFFEVICYEKST